MGRADKLLRENCRLVMGRPKTNSARVVLNVKCPPRLVARVVIGSGNIGRLGLAEEGRLLGLGPWCTDALSPIPCHTGKPTVKPIACSHHQDVQPHFRAKLTSTVGSTLMSQNKVSLLGAVVLGYLHSCVKVMSAKC